MYQSIARRFMERQRLARQHSGWSRKDQNLHHRGRGGTQGKASVLFGFVRAGIAKPQSVGVIMLVALAAFFLPHRDHASVRRLAYYVLQLDGRMVDAKPPAESFVDLA